MKQIKLTKGLYTLVDDQDFEWLNQWKWSADANNYAVRHETKKEYGNNKRKMVKMHKFIMGTPDGMETDHINRNRLDNRRENLRIVDAHGNQRNSKISTRNTSGYKGVYWDKKYKRWCARITYYGKRIFGGGFSDVLEAKKSYEELIKLYG